MSGADIMILSIVISFFATPVIWVLYMFASVSFSLFEWFRYRFIFKPESDLDLTEDDDYV